GTDGKRTRPAAWTDLGSARTEWTRVRQLALAGRAVKLSQNGTQVVAESPVRNVSGRVRAIVVVRTTDERPDTGQIATILVTGFGVGTVILFLVMAVPGIAVSFLVSYLVARGLTRRLESLSTVATAIASGDLEKRAPVTSGNEVG